MHENYLAKIDLDVQDVYISIYPYTLCFSCSSVATSNCPGCSRRKTLPINILGDFEQPASKQ